MGVHHFFLFKTVSDSDRILNAEISNLCMKVKERNGLSPYFRMTRV